MPGALPPTSLRWGIFVSRGGHARWSAKIVRSSEHAPCSDYILCLYGNEMLMEDGPWKYRLDGV